MEYCSPLNNSTMNKKKQFSWNLLSKFGVLCSCVLSHPLYLSYFLFFSPYLIKLLAFLSPLFLTTTLLILSIFTSILHESSSFSSLLENLQLGFVGVGEECIELEGFEEFEVYITVFGSSTFDPHGEFSEFGGLEENLVEISSFEQNPGDEKEEKVLGVLITEERESSVESSGEIEGKFCGIPITDLVEENLIEEEFEEEKILGVLISDERCFSANDEVLSEHSVQETPKCTKLMSSVVKAGEKSPQMADKKCVVSKFKPLELKPSSINGGNQTQQMKYHSTKHGVSVWDTNDENRGSKKHDDEDKFSYSSSPPSQPISPSLSNLGSMRKEKEWRRTLACKLFEERHNGGSGVGVGGGEEMDSLWETYEKTEENRGKQRSELKKMKSKMKSGLSFDEEYDEDEEDEDEGDNGKLCCLQALKFSAVKMNFGLGKPGFMKITKAFKGISGGWLSHQSRHHSGGGRKKGKSY